MPKSINKAMPPRQQFGALCYRVTAKGKLRVLLITSRGIGRWIVPKGWPMRGRAPWEAARVEAWEEAGVRGDIVTKKIGSYDYDKWRPDDAPLPCQVDLFPLEVAYLEDKFPEADQRQRKWFSPEDAADLVMEPELAEILVSFRPKMLNSTAN
ncbi:NUDIX hydrolase [Epibacterium ulvae]|uniref:NUDIX hydrolase n=1 Tax=Epibacterium ulvae TaxID=1156985 RepID=UPI001BFCA43C|nr:NUDIX hydrolase [Epibacterium ulvae]MBT8153115.1 NUDIX hydrolase [Epibacterium ulvae]